MSGNEVQANNVENTPKPFYSYEFGLTTGMDREKLRDEGYTESKLQKMAEYAEPPSGNEIDTSIRLNWLIWYYSSINRNDEKHKQYKNLESDHRKGKATILGNTSEGKEGIHGNAHDRDIPLSILVDPATMPKGKTENEMTRSYNKTELDNKTSEYLEIVDYLMKDEKLQANNFSKLTVSQINDLIEHLDTIEPSDKESYFRFLVLISETNHIYRDQSKNDSINSPEFEKLVDHLAKKNEAFISEISLDLDRFKTIEQIVTFYESEKNIDKKRFILDHIEKTFNSVEDKKYIEKHISKESLEDLKSYKESTEYQVINEFPVIDGHTLADILRQSPKETEKVSKSLMEAGFDTIKHPLIITGALIVFLFGGFSKMKLVSKIPGMDSFFGRIGLGIAATGLIVAGKDTGLWDSFSTNSEGSLADATKHIGDVNKYHEVNRVLRSNVDLLIINAPDASELSRTIIRNTTLSGIHLSKVNEFLKTGGITSAALFGSEENIPTKPNSDPNAEREKYTTDELKEYFTQLIELSNEGDITIKDVFDNEITEASNERNNINGEQSLAGVTTSGETNSDDTQSLADVAPDEETNSDDTQSLADATPSEETNSDDTQSLADATPSEETSTEDEQSLAGVTTGEAEEANSDENNDDSENAEAPDGIDTAKIDSTISEKYKTFTTDEGIKATLETYSPEEEEYFIEQLKKQSDTLRDSSDASEKALGMKISGALRKLNN